MALDILHARAGQSRDGSVPSEELNLFRSSRLLLQPFEMHRIRAEERLDGGAKQLQAVELLADVHGLGRGVG